MSEAFKKEYEPNAKVSKGLKINNKKSSVQKAVDSQKHNEEEFREQALKLISEQKDNNSKMVSLSQTLIKFIEDKTLAMNKSATALEVERETRIKLVRLALEMDNDDSITELNMGVISALQVAIKCLFILRDRLSEQEYNNYVLQKSFKDLESRIIKLESNNK